MNSMLSLFIRIILALATDMRLGLLDPLMKRSMGKDMSLLGPDLGEKLSSLISIDSHGRH